MPNTRFIDKEQLLAFTACCEKCGDYAFLARCEPDAFKRDGTEIWTYECVDSGRQMQRLKKTRPSAFTGAFDFTSHQLSSQGLGLVPG